MQILIILFMKQKQTKDLSLQEKMHLSLNDASRLYTRSSGIIIACFLVLLVIIPLTFLFNAVTDLYGDIVIVEDCSQNLLRFLDLEQSCREYITNTNPENLPKIIAVLSVIFDSTIAFPYLVLLILGGMVIWFVVFGRRVSNDMKNVKSSYIRQAYFFVLQTSTHENKDFPKEFMDIAVDIFPELKDTQKKMSKKGREWYKIDEKKDDVIFDIVADTHEGKFIVEFIRNVEANYEKIQRVLKIVKDHYKGDEIFRVVFLVKAYDKIFLSEDDSAIKKCNELEDLGIPFDLIKINQNGFDFLRINN